MTMKRAHGFTLIELMVGVALGLLATLVITQVFLQSEGNKRTTTSGADAQVAGASALFTLQRDIQAAGYGLTGWADGLGCPLSGNFNSTVVLNPAVDKLAPVVIGFGATSADSDTLTVMASGKAGYSVPIKVAAAHTSIDTKFIVASNLGVVTNDLMVAVPPAWSSGNGCTLFMVTGTTPSTEVPHAATSGWNASTAIYPSAGYLDGSVLLDLGLAPVRRRYSVDASQWSLQVQDTMSLTSAGAFSAAREIFPQVVLLKALYGKSTAAGGAVTSYSADAPVSKADWRLVQAVRVVVVARSAQFDRNAVTPNLPEWEVGSLAAGTTACRGNASSLCLTLDVSASGPNNDWQHYRYKVFDTVVPLRNVVWNP
ncbi:MAG: PilW family protein [Burkholderiales bacterium]|nr:PilW family protein [Burkholderiales bacterium]